MDKSKKSWYNILINVVLDVVIALLVFLSAVFIIFSPISVVGDSMENTIHDGDVAIVYRINDNKYKRNDVVVAKVKSLGKNVIKRVVGLPGDKLAFAYDGGFIKLYRFYDEEWKEVDEQYIKEDMLLKGGAFVYSSKDEIEDGFTVQKGTLYLLGDNRNNSTDSRSFGAVGYSSVVGKVAFITKDHPLFDFIFRKLYPFLKGVTHD